MSRAIITNRDIALARAKAQAVPAPPGGTISQGPPSLPQGAPPPDGPDDYPAKLMKYIPGEVVSLYVALEAVVKTSATNPAQAHGAYWFIFSVCLIGTPLYLWRLGKVHKSVQLLISTVAFAVWVFALGGPFDGWAWYETHRLYPALTLPIYTFLIALKDP
jgi:hypothetical protein